MLEEQQLAAVEISRDREQFLLELVRELAATIEDLVGVEAASGFISVVGSKIGGTMNAEYLKGLDADRLTRDQVAAALVDLKRRIDGGFSIESIDDDRIVLVNDHCPFGAYVVDRPSLCMMTSNVFGKVTAENLGYARVEIEEAIANRSDRCRVIVHLRFEPGGVPEGSREYFGESFET